VSGSRQASTSDPGGPQIAYADTNVFVALFAGAEHPGHENALRVFQRVADGTLRLIVAPMVVAELVYVARSVLGWERSTVTERLTAMLEADGLAVHDLPVLHRTLALYGQFGRLDFADAYIAAAALESGLPLVASLDADFDRIAGITRIKQ
jgi:predicted nucleic acid-binding protein